MNEIELRIPVITAQPETIISPELTVLQHGLRIRVRRTIMPDTGRTIVRLEDATLGIGPAPGAIEVNTPLHGTVLKIEHPCGNIPGTHGVPTIGPQDTMDHPHPGRP